MKYQFLGFSIAFGALGINALIEHGINFVIGGWSFIILSCGFGVLFLRDTVKGAKAQKFFKNLATVFFWSAVIFLLGSTLYRILLSKGIISEL